MSKWTVGVSQFGYYVVEAEDQEAAVVAAWELVNDRIEFNVDGTDLHDVEKASPWERVTE